MGSTLVHATQKALLLWLRGASLEHLRALDGAERLLERSAVVELDPSPITGPQLQRYQAFSGWLPARFGFFDTLLPLWRLPRSREGLSGYTIVEENAGRGALPRMLPDLLRSAGWRVEVEVVSPAGLLDCVRGLERRETGQPLCQIVECEPGADTPGQAGRLAAALRSACSWAGEDGLLAVLSDTRPARLERFVNINNFLAEMGVIERDAQTGSINWPGTLAYYAGHGQLWVNLYGRDPQGAVYGQVECEEVCTTLIEALPGRLRDPETGAQAVERVYRREELYRGEYLFCAPDLVVVFKPGCAPSPQSTLLGFDEATFTRPAVDTRAVAGAHPSDVRGFLLASAPGLRAGVSVPEPAPLTAVVPTLLHALNLPCPDVDGPALAGLFSPSYLESHPLQAYVQSRELSEDDEELVINRLRDLGYI